MPLGYQLVPIRMGSGIETKADPKSIGTKLVSFVNGVFEKEDSYSTRTGSVIIDSGGHFNGLLALETLRSELLAFSQTGINSYVAATASWENKGVFQPLNVTSRVLVSNLTAQSSCDGAAGAGLEVYAYEQGGAFAGIWVSVKDTGTGQITLQDFQLTSSGILPRVVFFNAKLYVFWLDPAANKLMYVSLSTPTTFTAPVALLNVYATVKFYDLVVWQGTSLFIAYQDPVNGLTVATYNTSIALQSSLNPGGNPTIISVNSLPTSSGNYVAVAFYVGGSIICKVYGTPSALALVSTSSSVIGSVVNITLEDRTTALYRVYWETGPGGSTGVETIWYSDLNFTSGAFAALKIKLNAGIAARSNYGSFSSSSGVLAAVYASPQQSTVFCLETTSGTFTTVGKALYGTSGGFTPKPWLPSWNSQNILPTIWQGDPTASSGAPGGIETTLGITLVTAAPAVQPMLSVEAGPDLLVAAGQLWSYNGVTCGEHGFSLYPDNLGVQSPGFVALKLNTGAGGIITTIQCPPASQVTPGDWLMIIDNVGALWEIDFPNGGATGNVDTAPGAANQTSCNFANNATSTDVANALARVLNRQFSGVLAGGTTATVSPGGIVTASIVGVPVPTNGGGFWCGTIQKGTNAVPEITTIIFPSGAHITGGQWLTIADNGGATPAFRVYWFKRTDVAADPNTAPTVTGAASVTEIDITSVMTANQVAAAFVAQAGAATTNVATKNTVVATSPANLSTPTIHSGNDGYVAGGVGSASNSATNSQYQIRATYRWINNGVIQESAPTPPVTVQVAGAGVFSLGVQAGSFPPGGGGSNVLVSVPTLQFTNKPSYASGTNPNGVEIVLWATTLNGTNFFRVTSVGAVPNDQTKARVTVQFSLQDNTLQGNDSLYTNGNPGPLEAIAPPACTICLVHRGRVVLGGIEGDPTAIWISNVLLANQCAVFNPANVVHLPQPVTALATMDEILVAWSLTGIYVIGGDGPDNTGFNGSFTTPSFVPGGVGCTAQNSVVQIPDGVMFISTAGTGIRSANQSPLYTFNRQLQLVPSGRDVEGLLATLPDPVSATTIPATTQVRFIFNGTTPSVVHYDYQANQWGTHNYPVAPVDSVVWKNQFVWGTATGGVYQETAGTATDGGVAFTMSFQTGWMSIGQSAYGAAVVPAAQNYDKVRSVFMTTSIPAGSGATLSYGYDDDPNFTDVDPWTAANGSTYPSGQAGSPPNQVRFDLHRQRMRSLQLTLTGVPPGASIQGLALHASVRPGAYKVAKPMGNYV